MNPHSRERSDSRERKRTVRHETATSNNDRTHLTINELQANMEQSNSEEKKKEVSGAIHDPKTPQNRPPKKLVSPTEIDRMETASTTKSKDSPASSKGSDDSIIMDDPDYIQPSQMDILLSDINSVYLHGDLSDLLQVEYLSVVSPEDQTALANQTRVPGKILDRNTRFIINIPCRRESRRNDPTSPRSALPYRNVFFVVDTGSPHSFLCQEAMEVLLPATNDGNPIPRMIRIELYPGGIFEFYLSPPGSHHSDVNILGGNVLRTTDLVSNRRTMSFTLSFE
jgi:hypothetical protein